MINWETLTDQDKAVLASLLELIAQDYDDLAINEWAETCNFCHRVVELDSATDAYLIGHNPSCIYLAARRILNLPTEAAEDDEEEDEHD